MRRAIVLFAAVVLLALGVGRWGAPLPAGVQAQVQPIAFSNYADGTTIRHPVPLLRGTLSDAAATSVEVVNESSDRPTCRMTGLAHKGRFLALTELVPGVNRLVLRAGRHQRTLRLIYKPQTNPYLVRIIYLTDKDGDTKFQTPIQSDPQNYQGKLDMAMKLMQTFTAERLNDLGFGRRTFNLELDKDGKVQVHTLRSDYSVARLHEIRDQELWRYVYGLVNRKLRRDKTCYLVIPAFTRYDGKTRRVYGHTALGGGELALFGGGDLFTWPDSLADVQKAFLDGRRIDTSRYFSDSVGRHTFWAAASTTMGAALHELGHTFGLPHTRQPFDIMTRGFDHFNRVFTFVEPAHAERSRPHEFQPDQAACWAPDSAVWLRCTRWLAMDSRSYGDEDRTCVRLDRRARSITVETPYGIGAVELAAKDDVLTHVPIDLSRPAPKTVELPLGEYGKYLKDETAAVRVIDCAGNGKHVAMKTLLAGPFVRSWQFASVTFPWDDKSAFVPLDAGKLKAIQASAAAAKLSTSGAPMVNFAVHFSAPAQQVNVAGYAMRTIRCDRPRKVRILAGSDDALRVWVNGKCVLETLALRGAEVDQDSAVADLGKGENTLLVEVSQALGGWYLCLRLEDAAGLSGQSGQQQHQKLLLTDDGRLEASPPVPGW